MSIPGSISCIMVIFGGTGDLTHRKLIPAIYTLKKSSILPENFAIVSIGRRTLTDEQYRTDVMESVKKFSRHSIDIEDWKSISEKIFYESFDFSDDEGYRKLNSRLKTLDDTFNTEGNRLYYLAVAPEYFGEITDKLHAHDMAENKTSWQRVVIEKPFGRDLKSAEQLNDKITKVFNEKNTFRIDHYLGKEMIQSIMVLRFANSIFEPLWNSKYISNIQLTSSETVGVESRGGYFEKAGALKDMVQNHMLQLLTLTAMEPPVNLDPDSIRTEKIKVLRSLEAFNPKLVTENIIRGQYGSGTIGDKILPAYRSEEKVSSASMVETFVALKLHVQNFRWAGVPFYIRTGKRMKDKTTSIVIQFKDIPETLYFKEYGGLYPNLLIIKVQPREGILFHFNTKRAGTGNKIIPVEMDFCQNCEVESNSPEAYERLLYDAMKGDSTLFTSWEEVEYSWRFVDTISNTWEKSDIVFPNYSSGSYGPPGADELLHRDNNKWWNF